MTRDHLNVAFKEKTQRCFMEQPPLEECGLANPHKPFFSLHLHLETSAHLSVEKSEKNTHFFRNGLVENIHPLSAKPLVILWFPKKSRPEKKIHCQDTSKNFLNLGLNTEMGFDNHLGLHIWGDLTVDGSEIRRENPPGMVLKPYK